ncbi:Sodium-coupled monocarboxylate transporter 1 [Armadillidium vulgare]|nr:Sodium-coupled monocarboxylate transporter 1 [Armadillidium vulgare]
MNPSIYERHNFYNTFAFGAFIYGAMFSISQINTQRVCAVATLNHCKLVLKINMVGMAIIHIFLFLGGLVVYAFYAGCDPQLSGLINKRDEILSFMIVDKLSHIYGLPGVYVATMIASTLSTFSRFERNGCLNMERFLL